MTTITQNAPVTHGSITSTSSTSSTSGSGSTNRANDGGSSGSLFQSDTFSRNSPVGGGSSRLFAQVVSDDDSSTDSTSDDTTTGGTDSTDSTSGDTTTGGTDSTDSTDSTSGDTTTTGTSTTPTIPNTPAPATSLPAATRAAIDGLKLPEGAYPAQIRVEGGVTGNQDGDVNASGQIGYYGDRLQGVLRGEVKLDRDPNPNGRNTVEYSLGGGVVIGLGDRARDPNAVNAQNTIARDLGTLSQNADRVAAGIGNDQSLSREQKLQALEEVGNQVAGQMLTGVMVAENSERGGLRDGLVNQIELQMSPPVGSIDPYAQIAAEYRRLGAESPFPATTREALRATVSAVEGAGENVAPPAAGAGNGVVNTNPRGGQSTTQPTTP